MKKLLFLLIVISACTKPKTSTDASLYTIQKGNHYCDQSTFKPITVTNEMKFTATFDSSCIYTSVSKTNQYDVNKLYGFSVGSDNHVNSARIGWGWRDNALRLFAYTYNNSQVNNQEITIVNIGQEVSCSIKLIPGYYVYTVNGVSVTHSRSNTNSVVSGFQQYPYFGGDEVAPHKITIKIK